MVSWEFRKLCENKREENEEYISSKSVEDLTYIWNYTYRTWSERQADEYYNMLVSSVFSMKGWM